jgi:hypothetical membrane protein
MPVALGQVIMRPTGVAVLAILMFLGGATDIGIVVLLLYLGGVTVPTLVLLPSIQLVGDLLLILAIFPLLFAMFSFILGFGLWTGRPWAWTWTLVSSIIGLIVSAVALIVGFGLVGVVIYGAFIYYLTRGRVKSYFGRGAPTEAKQVVAASTAKYEQVTQPETARQAKKISKVEPIATQGRAPKIAGTLLLVAWIQSIFFTSIAEGLYPDYNFHLNLVSDLGVQTGSAAIWTASVLATGTLLIVAGFALSNFGKSRRQLLVTLTLTGVGLLGLGVFNENAFYSVHLIFSLLADAFAAISALVVSLKLAKGLFRYFSLIFGFLMLVGMILLYSGFFSASIASVVFILGSGFAERIVGLPELAWFIAFGGYLIGTSTTLSEQ